MNANLSKVNIRQADLSDLDELIKIRILLFQEMDLIKTDSEESKFKNALKDYFVDSLVNKEFLSWIAEINGEVIASSGLIFLQKPPAPGNPSGREAYIMNMFTLAEWRKKGIASKLLQEILQHLRENGINIARLHATSVGRKVYKKIGFKQPSEPEMVLNLS